MLAEKLRPLDLPILDGPTLAIYSDYGGNARDSRFNTISLLFIDMERVHEWNVLSIDAHIPKLDVVIRS